MKLYVFTFLFLFTRFNAQASDTLKCPGGYFDSTLSVQVYDFAEVEPSFPGGEVAMAKFIQQNLRYSEMSKEMGVQGKVYIRFVVTVTGDIAAIEIINRQEKELTPLELECIRVLELMPGWIPGLCNGYPVAVRYQIPLNICPD